MSDSEIPDFSKDKINSQNHEVSAIDLDRYRNLVERFTLGPQCEGIEPDYFEQVIQDERTQYIVLLGSESNHVRIPFLASAQYAPWLNPNFLRKKGIETEALFFATLPQVLLRENSVLAEAALKAITDKRKGLSVIVDYPDFIAPLHEDSTLKPAVDHLVTQNGTPAATYHYSMDLKPLAGKVPAPESAPSEIKVIPQTKIDEYFERMRALYGQRFQELVDDHPINGALSDDELYSAVTSPTCSTFAYFDNDNQIQSFGYFERDLGRCPWLNRKFFAAGSEFPTIYMPAIVSAPNLPSPVSQTIMFEILCSNLREFGAWNLTFECTNLSATYIPKIILHILHHQQIAAYSSFRETKNYYEVVQFNP